MCGAAKTGDAVSDTTQLLPIRGASSDPALVCDSNDKRNDYLWLELLGCTLAATTLLRYKPSHLTATLLFSQTRHSKLHLLHSAERRSPSVPYSFGKSENGRSCAFPDVIPPGLLRL